MPDPRAAPYRDDLRWLGRIRLSAAARFRDDKIDISDCGEKVRALIAEYIGAERIEQLLEPVSILSPKFDEGVEKLENTDAKASEMEHAIKEELKIRYEENPVFYQTLRERLEQILAERKMERLSSAEELKRLRTLVQELRSVANIAESMGLTPVSFALYELLLQDVTDGAARAAEARAPYHAEIDEPKRELASQLEDQLRALAVIDWRTKDDVQREMRRQIKRQLRAAGMDGDPARGADQCCRRHRPTGTARMMDPEHGQLTFGSTVVRYTIVRSERRKKTVEVQVDGRRRVRVAAPAAATREKIERLLRTRSRWLITRLKRDDEVATTHEFVNGETFLYLGRQARLRILDAKGDEHASTRLIRGRLEVRIRPAATVGIRKRRIREALEDWYRTRADAKLRERVRMYSPQLGVEASGVVVRDQARRWGSCSKDGVLRFNWRVVMAPISLVDYVVVHELSHLAGNREHADAFWKTLASLLPDYEDRRSRLRHRGHEFAVQK